MLHQVQTWREHDCDWFLVTCPCRDIQLRSCCPQHLLASAWLQRRSCGVFVCFSYMIVYTANNGHEKNSPFWLVKSSAVFFLKQCRKELIQCKKRKQTKHSDWLMIKETHLRWPIKSCFEIKRMPWMAQWMAQVFPDCVIRVRSFSSTISQFFHIYYIHLIRWFNI